MHPNALLDIAADLLAAVSKLDAPADGVVSAYFRQHRELGQRERHTLAETTYEVLRRRTLYKHLAQSGPGREERRLAMLGWQGSAAFLESALQAGEVAWLEQARAVDRHALAPALRHNLPEWLAEPLLAKLGDEGFWALVESLNQTAPLDLRVNAMKVKREAAKLALAEADIESEATPYSPSGLRVKGKPVVNKLDAFNRGDFEIQDEGSQLLALLTDAKRGEIVVDFCAGAGGKTLALGAAMRNTGRLYAFDTSGHRLDALKPRLERSGLTNVYPTQITHELDPRVARMAGKVDRVLVDAPCSGLGTLRRSPDLKWRQTPKTIAGLAVQQAAILRSAARLLKPGGRLVYATCSLLEVENEAIADAFSAEGREFVVLPAEEALQRAHVSEAARLVEGANLRLWPHRHGTDGFFAAVWQRR